ncbi:rubrerythrin family protein [Alistipes sp.]|uniref:rubrerythrin family protein n=1 Tax=Alistipes sp. TaxID=1872444 RepID=UPI003AF0D6BD
MKLRPLFILLLFVVSAGILVWIYYTARRTPREPKASPWAETISDLDACCRRKHVKSMQYDHFAQIADEERKPAAARLFRAMSRAEEVQERNCSHAIVRLGGKYDPPAKVVVFHGPTADNLRRSIDYERRNLSERNGGEIDRAMTKNNRYAARVLIWATAGDLRHQAFMELYLARQRHKEKQPSAYRVCPMCGNIFEAEYTDPYCPYCLTAGQEFIAFE